MSWKFGGIYFKKDYSADINALFNDIGYEYAATGQSLSLEEATRSSFMDSAVGIINKSTLLHNNFIPHDCSFEPGESFDLDETLAKLSNQSDVLCFFLDGITDSYGFSLFTEGKRVRCRGVYNGKVVMDEGPPLPGEKGKHDTEEDRVFSVMERFTQRLFNQMLDDKKLKLHHYIEKK